MANISKFVRFLKTDIWRIRANKLPKTKFFLIQQLRIVLLALRGFNEDKCQLRASALTFYSLLSVVPVVAMAFGIAKGFGFESMLEAQLYNRLPGQEEIVAQIIGFSNAFLENTRGGLIAGIGVVILFWTVIKVLGNIETSFNDIWGIKKGRGFSRKFSDYLSIMLICPILLIMSSSATVLVASQITAITQRIEILGAVAPFIFFSLKLLPFVVIWVMFTFIYIFMPNTKVKLSSALMGGVIAGTVYQIVQWAYINFQIGASKYGAIYGSFAALPLFLVWLQVSWLIVLFGAEVSFAKQNVDTYEFEPDCLKASRSFRRFMALAITHLCIKHLYKGDLAPKAEEISHVLESPIRLTNEILFNLTEAGVLAEVKRDDGATGYQPARNIELYTIKNVVKMIDDRGVDSIPVVSTKEMNKISDCLKGLEQAIETSKDNLNLKDI
ncbi:MAG: YihY/virulence factor BrkB family protein [Candidatus Omnitrophica bacterium]|nr:YihY/virulence factor BrkB family protein [Candidatus Omnitrophota bacterium]